MKALEYARRAFLLLSLVAIACSGNAADVPVERAQFGVNVPSLTPVPCFTGVPIGTLRPWTCWWQMRWHPVRSTRAASSRPSRTIST